MFPKDGPARRGGLELSVTGREGATNDVDDSTKSVGRPSVRLGVRQANQRFLAGESDMLAGPITIAEDSTEAAIGKGRGVRLELQGGFRWSGVGERRLSGSVDTADIQLHIEPPDSTVLSVDISRDFVAGDSLTIACLRYTPPGGETAVPRFVHLLTGGPGDPDSDAEIPQAAVVGSLTVDASREEVFWRGDVPRRMAPVSVIAGSRPILQAGDTLRVSIPRDLEVRWIADNDEVRYRSPRGDSVVVEWATGPVEVSPEGAVASTFIDNAYRQGEVGSSLGLVLASQLDSADTLTLDNLWIGDYGRPFRAPLEVDVGLGDLEVECETPDRRFLMTTTNQDKWISELTIHSLVSGTAQTFLADDPDDDLDRLEAGSQALEGLQLKTTYPGGFSGGLQAHLFLPPGFGAEWVGDVLAGGQVVRGLRAGARSQTVNDLSIRQVNAVSPSSYLEVALVPGGATADSLAVVAVDDVPMRIGAPEIALEDTAHGGQAAMVFIARDAVGPGGTPDVAPVYPLVVTEDSVAAALNSGDIVEIRIPSDFNAIWSQSAEPTVSGSKVRLTEVSDRRVTFRVDAPLESGESFRVTGLHVTNLLDESPEARLELAVRTYRQESRQTMRIGRPSLISADQVFVVGDVPTALQPFELTENGVGTITAARDLKLVIPEGLPLRWDNTVVDVSVSGTGSSKVDSVTFDASGDTCRIHIHDDFAAGEVLRVGGGIHPLRVIGFEGRGKGSILALITDASHAIEDDASLYVGAPRIESMAEQAFVMGDSAVPLVPFYLIEDPEVSTLRPEQRIAVVLPDSGHWEWDWDRETDRLHSIPVARVGTQGEIRGDSLLVTLLDTVALGDTIAIWGLRVNATGRSPKSGLGLAVSASGHVHVRDPLEKWVGNPRVELDRDVALAIDSTAIVEGKNGSRISLITISDTTVPPAFPGDVVLEYRDQTGYLRHVYWDSVSVTVGGDVTPLQGEGKLVIHLDDEARVKLAEGRDFDVSVFRLRFEPAAYDSVQALPKGGITGNVAMGVHGIDDPTYELRVGAESATVVLSNPHRGELRARDDSHFVRAFTPTVFTTPRAYSTYDTAAGDTTTWVAFYSAVGDSVELLDQIAVSNVYSDVGRQDTLFESGGVPAARAHIDPVQQLSMDSTPVAVREVKLEIGRPSDPEYLRDMSGWFDAAVLDSTRIEPVFVSAELETADAESTHIRTLHYVGSPTPMEARQPLAARYVNPDDEVDGTRLELSGVGEALLLVDGEAGWHASVGSPTTVITGPPDPLDRHELLAEGLHELWFYGSTGVLETLSVPVIRQVVVDCTDPVVASAVDGVPEASSVSDSLGPPGDVTARGDTNMLRPTPGLSSTGEGLTISPADTLRTRISDNLLVRREADGARVVVNLAQPGEPDTLHFQFPEATFTTRLEFLAVRSDGDTVEVGADSLWKTLPQDIRKAMAIGDSTLGDSSIARTIEEGWLGLDIALTFVGDQEDVRNLVFPIGLLPGVMQQDGVELKVRVVATDLANNEGIYEIGVGPTRYSLSIPDLGDALVGKLINFPNPFRTLPESSGRRDMGTTLRFTLTAPAEAKLRVFDVLGDQVYVATLGLRHAGENLITWPGRDLYNNPLAGGVYFGVLEVKTDETSETRKVIMAVLNRASRRSE